MAIYPLSFAALANPNPCQSGNVYEDLACYQQQVRLIQPKIDAAYHELVQLNLYDAHQNFAASQTLWRRWIEKDCIFASTPATEAQGAGYGLAKAECTYNRYAERLKQVQHMIQELRAIKSNSPL